MKYNIGQHITKLELHTPIWNNTVDACIVTDTYKNCKGDRFYILTFYCQKTSADMEKRSYNMTYNEWELDRIINSNWEERFAMYEDFLLAV